MQKQLKSQLLSSAMSWAQHESRAASQGLQKELRYPMAKSLLRMQIPSRYHLPGTGLMQEVTGAPTLAISHVSTWCWRGQPQAQEGYSLPSHRFHCWSTPSRVPEQHPITSGDRAWSWLTVFCSSVSQLGLRLLCSVRFAAVSSPFSFGHLLFPSPSLPRVGGGTGGFGSQWQWEGGEGSESSCRGGSWYKALLVAQVSAFKSTYFPYQGVRLSHLISFHYIFD